MTGAQAPPPLGHPAGLRTLFFTELWERFSYYGMRALLVLFLVDAGSGMGLDDQAATAIYGLYSAAVYIVALPGGWIADRLLGAQRAVWIGGIIIAIGHFTLALPATPTFFAGLMFIIAGTGLLKPNISAIVGALYARDDARRDAGFTLFYMGINLGAGLGPLVCSTLGESERFGWHYGFAAAGVGMLAGLIYFRSSRSRLGGAGLKPTLDPAVPEQAVLIRSSWRRVVLALAMVIAVAVLIGTGIIEVTPVALARGSAWAIAILATAYFAWLLLFGGLDRQEKQRVLVIIVLFLGAATFWSGFEQSGSSLNLFAERYTDRMLGGFEIPAGWFQSLNPVFVISFAPVFAALWVGLARRGLNLPTPAKFGIGLLLLAAGFGVMLGAATLVATGRQALPTWLIFTYLFHTLGELALSPVGLSATTRLAPQRYVGQMMGIWFLASSVGNILAGLFAGQFRDDVLADMPGLYLQIVLMTAGAGMLFLVFTRPIRRLMGDAG
ncbi:MAG: MFS transporter [Gammaproteobacteria bacterium]|nr:MAG: MFS transporter [Pseudomonadota bacterium]MBC6945827.1 MFS transporter [Gammaproteobacteria bacterium]MCE7895416.1 MFS transporter [Gammaproteobacteria bacterium PRO8]MDL1879813.1 peptide MFS transporter [Gammaproteobacteria bacterium PRO2]MCL4776932.1 peptide MFS transporter [Gammaproteobacteria bacterium]